MRFVFVRCSLNQHSNIKSKRFGNKIIMYISNEFMGHILLQRILFFSLCFLQQKKIVLFRFNCTFVSSSIAFNLNANSYLKETFSQPVDLSAIVTKLPLSKFHTLLTSYRPDAKAIIFTQFLDNFCGASFKV